jgi:uncharacterized protein (TIGR03086 family)
MFISTSQHRRLSDVTLELVGHITLDDLRRPTPCSEWDVRALLEHMIGQDVGFTAALAQDVDAHAFAPRSFDGTPVQAYTTSSTTVSSALEATDPDRQVLLPELGADARFPAHLAVDFHGLDVAVHGWDLAVSLGEDVDYDDDLVAAVLNVARLVPIGLERTIPGALFAPAIVADDDASHWHKVLNLVGRDPHWAPSAAAAEAV